MEKIKRLEAQLEGWNDLSIKGLQRRTVIQTDVLLAKRIIEQDLGRISRYKQLKDLRR